MSKNKPFHICIVKLSALGDIVHAMIVIELIKNFMPESFITWIVDSRFYDLLKGHNRIDKVMALPLKDKKYSYSFSVARKYREQNGLPDVVIDLQGLLKSAIVCRVIGGFKSEIVGFDMNSIREKIASFFYTKRVNVDYGENIIIRNATLACSAIGFKFTYSQILNKAPLFNIANKPTQNKVPIVLICPFASEPSKCYDKFRDVILGLDGALDIFLCYGNESEKSKAEKIILGTNAKLTDLMSLNELTQFISGCDLVIGNDSGVTHLAWAQNRPSITLFGNRPSYRNAFVTDKNLVIDTGKKIDPKRIDKNDFSIQQINPQDVINAARSLLGFNKNGDSL